MNPTSDLDAIRLLERRLAVATSWGLFGSFGMGFVLSGFREVAWWMGLGGYALLVVGFIGHVIINRMFHTEFSSGEIALGLVVFGVSALSFIGSWALDPSFGRVSLGIGLTGFAAMTACLVCYLVIGFGLRGSYQMIHSLRGR